MDVMFVDAKNALYRWGWVGRNLTNSDGMSTGAVFGVLNAVCSLRKHFPDCKVVVCWDGLSRFSTWRSKVFPDYKAHRAKPTKPEPPPLKEVTLQAGSKYVDLKVSSKKKLTKEVEPEPEVDLKVPKKKLTKEVEPEPEVDSYTRYEQLCWQIEVLKRIFAMLGIPQCEDDAIEADDWISILAQAVMDQGDRAMVYTNDQDYLQLMARGVKLCTDTKGKFVDESFIKSKYKCNACDVLKIRALLGDTSDGIPRAVSGVGEVAAAKFIALGVDPSVERFEDLPRDVRLAAPRVGQAWARVRLNYRLMRLPTSAADPELSTVVQKRVTSAVQKVLKLLAKPAPRSRDDYDKFIKLLQDLDLKQALENRLILWKIAR